MKNFIQPGKSLTVAAPSGGVTSGDFIMVGALYGVCATSASAGADVEISVEGVFSLSKATGAWSRGDQLFWDAAEKKFTTDSTKIPVPAFAAADAASDDTAGQVRLGMAQTGLRVVCGQLTTVTAADTVATGLSKVLSVVAGYETDPAATNIYVSAQIGDQDGAPVAGSIIVKTWKATAADDATPTAAVSFGKKVNWIAVGF